MSLAGKEIMFLIQRLPAHTCVVIDMVVAKESLISFTVAGHQPFCFVVVIP